MAYYQKRSSSVSVNITGKVELQAGASYTVMVCKNGATVKSASTGTTVTVEDLGSFIANDWLIVNNDTATYRQVSSINEATKVLTLASAVTVATGDRLINLGADTGGTTPDYAGGVSIYDDIAGTNAATNPITTDSNGGYTYWIPAGTKVDELIRNTSGTPVGNVQDLTFEHNVVNVKDWGATGDGSTDDILAINRAISAIKGSVEKPTSDLSQGGTIFFPEGEYLISTPIITYSAIKLIGEGPNSHITEGGSFTGTELIQLDDVAAGGYYSHGVISGLELESTTTGVAAIRQNVANVVNSVFENLVLKTEDGIILDDYTQHCRIENVYSYGDAENIIYLKGNANQIRRIDKEGGGTGTDAGAYIVLEDHTAGSSKGNILEHILLEGTTNSNKSGIKFISCLDTVLRDYWFEPTNSDGYSIRLDTCINTRIESKMNRQLVATGKIKIDTSSNTWIEFFDADGADVCWEDLFEIDADSDVHVENLYNRRGEDARQVDNARITVGNAYSRQIYTDDSAGFVERSTQKYLSGQNMLVNPSFEAGNNGWTWSTAPNTTEEYITSHVGQGLMGHFKWSSTGTHYLRQEIAIDSSWVGKTLTVSGLAKTSGSASAYITPYIAGGGITASTGYGRITNANKWTIFTQTFTIASNASIYPGVYFIVVAGTDEFWVDELCVAFGTEVLLGAGRFNYIELGAGAGKTITNGSAAPTAGTWKQGDIVFNTGAAAAGTVGWVCTTAGSPGTWKTFGTIAS